MEKVINNYTNYIINENGDIYSYISKCCKGKKETAYGYVWKYERSDDLSVYQY